MPVFDAVGPRRKSRNHKWAVLGLFNRNNEIGRRQISLRKRSWKSLIGIVGHARFSQAVECVSRDWAIVATVKSQAARVGSPRQAALLGLPVEKYFSKSAAIIVARAQEEN